MKNRIFSYLNHKDWYVIVALLLILVLTICIGVYTISSFNEEDVFDKNIEQLTTLANLCTIVFPLFFLLSLYFFVKTTISRNEKNQKEKEALLQLEQKLILMQDFYENTPIGFHSIDIEGNFLDMNNVELEWLGYTREEVVGKMNFEDITVRSTTNLQELLGQLIRKGKLDNLEGEFICKDGSLLSIMTNSRLLYNENGQIESIRVAVMNYSEKKKIQDELKKAKEIAEHSSLLKDQFVANVSHEIRTPLNAILSFSKLLERTPLNERQKEFTSNIHTGSENLLTIINDILDFSKIEAGVLRIENIPFNPRNVIEKIENMFRYKVAEKEIEFEVKVSGEVPEMVMGDPNRLSQILVNLLGNAFKFTDKGNILFDTNIVSENNNAIKLQFEVKDTGVGIPRTKLDEIFERFGQASTESTRKFGGAGLGLTITKQLVDLQNGSIEVHSEEGEGSTFLIEIPYSLEISDKRSSKGYSEGKLRIKHNDLTILVAEDNPTNRRIFELQFEEWGLKADFANNGQIAVEMLRKKAYDIILMDIQMPVMDGYQATKYIREELKITMPIIAITAHVFSGEREKCIDFGMNDYLTKPIKEEAFFKLLKNYLPESNIEFESSKKYYAHLEADFDRKYIFALTRGNKELLVELATLTIQQSKLEMEEIETALQQEKYNNMAASAHSMRSTALNMGFNKLLGPILEDLGQAINKETPDMVILKDLVIKLKELREEVEGFLKVEFLEN